MREDLVSAVMEERMTYVVSRRELCEALGIPVGDGDSINVHDWNGEAPDPGEHWTARIIVTRKTKSA